MNILYLDLFSGISGDMFLGALLDLGVPLSQLETELGRLGVPGYHLHAARTAKSGIEGVKFDVHLDSEHTHTHTHTHTHPHAHGPGHGGAPDDHAHAHPDEPHSHPAHTSHSHPHPGASHSHSHGHDHEHEHHHEHEHEAGHGHEHPPGRSYADIRRLIHASGLDAWVKDRALAVFRRIAVAEGKIHGQPPDAVHFHEVGAIDSIVDAVGACVALNLLGRPRVLAGPVIEGTGFVRCAHGRMPLPAPATLEILAARGVAVTQCEEPHELVTPTGAAILAEFAESFGPLQGLIPRKIGYGLGSRDNHTRPNVLRAVLAEPSPLGDSAPASTPASASGHDWETDTIQVLETNLDDLSPEILGNVLERALAAGALDVFHTPVQMKKGRPGTLLTVLCPPAAADRLTALLLTETSAFGVRWTQAGRCKLRREFRQVPTSYGEVTVKLGLLDGRVIQKSPEFESCRKAADAAGVPLKAVYEAALRAEADGR